MRHDSSTQAGAHKAPAVAADALDSMLLAGMPLSLHAVQLSTIHWRDPWRWLNQGWQDFRACPGLGLFYGSCFVVMGWAGLLVFRQMPAFSLALMAGFLLMGPFLALGLYYASMRLERGLTPDLGRSLSAWDMRADTLCIFGLVLLALALAWVGCAVLVFATVLTAPLDLAGSLAPLLAPQHRSFVMMYLAVALAFGVLIYAISVISLPLMLDQHIDAVVAMQVSLRLVRTQPGVMALWALILAGLVMLAMLPAFLGLLVVGPVLGHASWHAYRSAVQDRAPLVILDQEPPDALTESRLPDTLAGCELGPAL